MSELRRLLDDPGVQHLLPPNWKDRVVAEVDRLTEALATEDVRLHAEWRKAEQRAEQAERLVTSYRDAAANYRDAADALERAEADLAATNEALEAWKGHTRSAEADLADEKRRHAELRAGVEALADEWEHRDRDWAAPAAELRAALRPGGEDR